MEYDKHGYEDRHEDVEDGAHESDDDRQEIPNDQHFPVDGQHDGDSTLQEFDDELEDVTNNNKMASNIDHEVSYLSSIFLSI